MRKRNPATIGSIVSLLFCVPLVSAPIERVSSPDGRIQVTVATGDDGSPYYQVDRDGRALVLPSRLGFILRDSPDLLRNLRVVGAERRRHDSTWRPVWGQQDEIRENFREMVVHLQEAADLKRSMDLVFRVFDDGLGFRYVLPQQEHLNQIVIQSEETEFRLTGDHTAWWIPDDWDTYELLYTESPLSRIGKIQQKDNQHTHTTGGRVRNGAATPLTMRTEEGLFLAIHEAALLDYAGMTLVPNPQQPSTLKCRLTPWPTGEKVRGQTPLQSPWRTLQIAERAGGLIESNLILNLNRPSVIEDTSYIRPLKYVGIWWSLQLGVSTWAQEGGRHGATTARAKSYIDFAAANNIDGVLVEGWNTGWEQWFQEDNFDFVTPYDDFDLPEVARYAKEHGVELIGHHETGGQALAYEEHLEQAFELYRSLGVRLVKIGYAGRIRPEGYYHHSQWMVRHYQKVLEAAARYQIMINVHEPIKLTGLSRTYPNLMTGAGARTMEWNAWSTGNPPSHTAILPFTRLLAGPLDYSPGVFDLRLERFADQYHYWNSLGGLDTHGQVNSTLARQLALYIVLYSPLQMASDMIENYDGHPAFEFIRQVPVDWAETRVIHAQIGRLITVARRARGTGDWYLGSITNEVPRSFPLTLSFLDPSKTYEATFYGDAVQTNFRDNPTPLEVDRRLVKPGETIVMRLAPGGGQAVMIRAIEP